MAPGSGVVIVNRPGKGGVSEGRGDAALSLDGSTPESSVPLKAERLPFGAPIPNAPSVVTYGRAAPETNPVADVGAGHGGDEGSGAATWRRRVAPHLREVVRAYFTPPNGTPPENTTAAPSSGIDGASPSSEGSGAATPAGK